MVRLNARLFTCRSGPCGIPAVTTQLSRVEAVVLVSATDAPWLPKDAAEIFSLEIALPQMHPFPRRCLRCKASVSAVALSEGEQVEVMVVIHQMRIVLLPALAVAAAGRTRGGAGEGWLQ